MSSVSDDSHDDLTDVRGRLDALDGQLAQILIERGRLIREVIDFKRAHGVGVVDRRREDAMLSRIEALASDGGLDPRIARHVLRAVIDAYTLMEVEQLGGD